MFNGSTVWRELNSRRRAAVLRSIALTDASWFRFRLPASVTMTKVQEFAHLNLLRGFFERQSRIVTAVTAMPTESGIVLGIALSPHPADVSLPAWGCSFHRAIRMAFGNVTRIVEEPWAKRE